MPENPLEAQVAAFFRSLHVRPTLLGLGEPTHGLQAFPYWRNQILNMLVTEYGFRSIALESSVLAGRQVNEFVTGGPSTLDEAMDAGFSHGFGAYAANRDLVEWLRNWNAANAEAKQVRFYGFDAPMENMWAASPRRNLLALHAFLTAHLGELDVQANTIQTLCGDDARWTNEAAAMNPAESVGSTPEARELRVLADDLQTLLHREAPRLHASPGFGDAELHARTALGLLRYHANMARTAANRLPTMLALRDLMMADNLRAIARREQERGPTLVFAHNLHLQRGVSGMKMAGQRVEWWGAGAHLTERMGAEYAFIASGLGQAAALGIGEAAPDTIEGYLMGLPGEVNLLTDAEVRGLLPSEVTARADFPPQAFPLKKTLLDGADGILFVRDGG